MLMKIRHARICRVEGSPGIEIRFIDWGLGIGVTKEVIENWLFFQERENNIARYYPLLGGGSDREGSMHSGTWGGIWRKNSSPDPYPSRVKGRGRRGSVD